MKLPKSQLSVDEQEPGQKGWETKEKCLLKSKKLIKELINLWVKTSDQSKWEIAVQLQEKKR